LNNLKNVDFGSRSFCAGDSDDALVGGDSRNILIGGNGSDHLRGKADEEVLIAGSTAFDADNTALAAIMSEWTRPDRTYAQRVADVMGLNVATGSNGEIGTLDYSKIPSRLNGAYFLRGDDVTGAGQTVFTDTSVDYLTGNAGVDVFFFNRVADNGGSIDVVNDLGTTEVSEDTDLNTIP
jgi:Ca2+-binding RTX toxin-like protein